MAGSGGWLGLVGELITINLPEVVGICNPKHKYQSAQTKCLPTCTDNQKTWVQTHVWTIMHIPTNPGFHYWKVCREYVGLPVLPCVVGDCPISVYTCDSGVLHWQVHYCFSIIINIPFIQDVSLSNKAVEDEVMGSCADESGMSTVNIIFLNSYILCNSQPKTLLLIKNIAKVRSTDNIKLLEITSLCYCLLTDAVTIPVYSLHFVNVNIILVLVMFFSVLLLLVPHSATIAINL